MKRDLSKAKYKILETYAHESIQYIPLVADGDGQGGTRQIGEVASVSNGRSRTLASARVERGPEQTFRLDTFQRNVL